MPDDDYIIDTEIFGPPELPAPDLEMPESWARLHTDGVVRYDGPAHVTISPSPDAHAGWWEATLFGAGLALAAVALAGACFKQTEGWPVITSAIAALITMAPAVWLQDRRLRRLRRQHER